MDLIIVESPTKARTLNRFLDGKFSVIATYGHVRDLPEKKIGILINREKDRIVGIEPEYVQTNKQNDRTDEIKKMSKNAKNIYLATDPDREGEAIAWHTQQIISTNNQAPRSKKIINTNDQRIKRIVFHEITQRAITEALAQPREIDMPLVDAQQARRVLDRLVGYKLSPLLWRKIRKGLSAGRVQSVAVRLIVEKEREIEAFKPEEYWVLQVKLAKSNTALQNANDQIFVVNLAEKNGEKYKISNVYDAESVEKELRAAVYKVESVQKKDIKKTPPAPFTTSTLQQAASNRLGWSAKRTMQIAQSLYEQGHITYHRTDSTNMAAEALSAVKEYIIKTYGSEYSLDKPRLYQTKSKVAQEAHEAIRPTDVNNQAPLTNNQLNKDEHRLFELIWRRFVACQMAEARGVSVRVSINGNSGTNNYGLEAKGETLSFPGWLILYQENHKSQIPSFKQITNSNDQSDQIEENEGNKIPELEEGEGLQFVDMTKEQKYTQPPARYNDASLIKKLEELEIGRPSTYAPTLSTIQDRQYVEKLEKRFKPTALGVAVNDFLVTNFSNILNYEFTARMEDELDDVANGKLKWEPVIAEFFAPFEERLGSVQDTAIRVKVEVESTGEKCPMCMSTGSEQAGDLVVRIGKFGKFVACSRYPECKYRATYVQKAGVKCEKCASAGSVPAGEIIIKKTGKGKTFYGCSNYPNCNFASWNKPHPKPIESVSETVGQ